LSVRHNEELDPSAGPGFGCFVTQAIGFTLILFLVAVGLFTFHWPAWLLIALLVVTLVLLFGLSMTGVFLLRVFFAERRRRRGRHAGVATEAHAIDTSNEEEPTDAART